MYFPSLHVSVLLSYGWLSWQGNGGGKGGSKAAMVLSVEIEQGRPIKVKVDLLEVEAMPKAVKAEGGKAEATTG